MMKGMVELISRIVNDDANASPNVRDLKHIVTCFESMEDWGLKVITIAPASWRISGYCVSHTRHFFAHMPPKVHHHAG
jgi:hypothetical protein